jgi:hypothetical protein
VRTDPLVLEVLARAERVEDVALREDPRPRLLGVDDDGGAMARAASRRECSGPTVSTIAVIPSRTRTDAILM